MKISLEVGCREKETSIKQKQPESQEPLTLISFQDTGSARKLGMLIAEVTFGALEDNSRQRGAGRESKQIMPKGQPRLCSESMVVSPILFSIQAPGHVSQLELSLKTRQ